MKTIKGYKILYKDGQAPNQSGFRYNYDHLPSDHGPGGWIECSRSEPLRICGWGFHAYHSPEVAKANYAHQKTWALYEVEFDVSVPSDVLVGERTHTDKFCGYRMRFLRVLETQDGPYVLIRYGDIVWQ